MKTRLRNKYPGKQGGYIVRKHITFDLEIYTTVKIPVKLHTEIEESFRLKSKSHIVRITASNLD